MYFLTWCWSCLYISSLKLHLDYDFEWSFQFRFWIVLQLDFVCSFQFLFKCILQFGVEDSSKFGYWTFLQIYILNFRSMSMLKVPLNLDFEISFIFRFWQFCYISILEVTLKFDFKFLVKWPFLLVRVTLAIISLI